MPDRVISVPQATQIATRIKNKFDNVNGRLGDLKEDLSAERTGDLKYCPLAYYSNTSGTAIDFKSIPRNTYNWGTYEDFKAGFEEANIPNLGWANNDSVVVYKIAGHRTAETLCTVIIRNFTKSQELTLLYFGTSSVNKYRWVLPTSDFTKQYLPADAKAVGDAFNGLNVSSDNVRKLTGIIPLSWVVGYAFPTNGQFYPTNTNGIHSDFFSVTPGETLSCTETGLSAIPSVLFYTFNDTASWISSENLTGKTAFTVPANANYAIFGLYRSSEAIPVSSADVVVWDGNTKYYDVQFKEIELIENDLQATNGSYKIQCGVNSGASNATIKIPLKIYAGGAVNFRIVNEIGFPSGISFTGYQVRNDSNGVVITTKKRNWTVNAFNSEYITIGAYFGSALDSNYTFDVEISFTSEAVHDVLSNIVGIGVHTDRYEGFGNFNIYGINRTGSILQDASGNYDTPPIEISGGHISGLTIKETGGVSEHSAYCIHTDNASNANNSLLIEDCYIESNSSHCMGVGTRIGYDLTIRNCIFKITNNTESGTVCVYIHNSNNGETTSAETASHVTFVGCTFISDSDKCIKLQDWKGTSTDYVEFTFIDCTFSPASGDVDDSVYIEYRSYTPEEFDSQEFKNKFSLSGNSVNNNVLWLNATRS